MEINEADERSSLVAKIEEDLKLTKHPIPIFCDRSAVYWTTNNNHSDRSKHMNVRYQRLNEEIENKNVVIKFVEGTNKLPIS